YNHVTLQVEQEPIRFCCLYSSPDASLLDRCSPSLSSNQDDPRPSPRDGPEQGCPDHARQLWSH
ncbi:hypothetical protein BGX29_004749, partial [Mortierella sp. GBA35]